MDKALVILTLSLAATAVPTILYVLTVWWLDRYEKEPLSHLAGAFLWGAVPGVLFSLAGEAVAGVPTRLIGGSIASVVDTSLTAPIVEEVSKGLVLLLLFLTHHSEFDDVLDGIVYGSMVGFGFAMTENFFYFLSAFDSGGFGEWGTVVFMRSVVFGLNHALFTSITGAGLGLVRYSRDLWQRLLIPLLALTGAIAFHSIHNLFAQLNALVCGAVLVSLISDWAGIALIGIVAVLCWQKEKGWIVAELAEEVRWGILTGQEYSVVQSPLKRLGARLAALNAGSGDFLRLGRFFQLATELAFKKHQARTMGDEDGNLAEIARLRAQLAALRAQSR